MRFHQMLVMLKIPALLASIHLSRTKSAGEHVALRELHTATHNLRSSSISMTFWQPVAGFETLNCPGTKSTFQQRSKKQINSYTKDSQQAHRVQTAWEAERNLHVQVTRAVPKLFLVKFFLV